MSNQESDAIVFFGASGDLAYKQIFPSLLRLVRDEGINVPIVGERPPADNPAGCEFHRQMLSVK